MAIIDQRINYYEKNAEEFCQLTKEVDMSFCRDKFLEFLVLRENIQNSGGFSKSKIHILDAGCGSGRDANSFLDAGYHVTAIDASPKICKEAEKRINQTVFCMNFKEMEFFEEFDGIWACASLLHISQMMIQDSHFAVEEIFITPDVRVGREKERWINVLARKQ